MPPKGMMARPKAHIGLDSHQPGLVPPPDAGQERGSFSDLLAAPELPVTDPEQKVLILMEKLLKAKEELVQRMVKNPVSKGRPDKSTRLQKLQHKVDDKEPTEPQSSARKRTSKNRPLSTGSPLAFEAIAPVKGTMERHMVQVGRGTQQSKPAPPPPSGH